MANTGLRPDIEPQYTLRRGCSMHPKVLHQTELLASAGCYYKIRFLSAARQCLAEFVCYYDGCQFFVLWHRLNQSLAQGFGIFAQTVIANVQVLLRAALVTQIAHSQ